MMRKAATLYLSGPSGVGKTEVAEILADRHGYAVLSLGGLCRLAAERRGLPTDRVTLQRMGDEMRRGDDARLARDAYMAALRGPGPVVIEGVRLRAEGGYLAAQGVIGVRVEAPEAARWARLLARDGSAQVPQHRTESEVPPHALVLYNGGGREALVRAVWRMVNRAAVEYAATRQGRW